MKKIVIDGFSFTYTVRRTTKKKIYIRVKDGVVVVSATKMTKISEVESLLAKHLDFIQQNLKNDIKENVIHFNGISYDPRFFISNKSNVLIVGNEIHIFTKEPTLELQKKALYDFYQREVEKELNKLICAAMYDFSEIDFPTLSVRYMKTMFGNYHSKKNHIKISSLLGKYDFKYIKHVLYHELCHVTEFNHSKKFFELFEKKYKDALIVRKTLKKIKYNDYL